MTGADDAPTPAGGTSVRKRSRGARKHTSTSTFIKKSKRDITGWRSIGYVSHLVATTYSPFQRPSPQSEGTAAWRDAASVPP